jgi:hypothetical protein
MMGIPGAGFGVLQPKQRHKWRATFAGLAKLVTGAQSKEITRQLTMCSRPSLTFEETTMHRYNSTAYVAGKHSWSEMTMTVEDDISGLASYAIQGQLETQQRIIGADLDGAYFNSATAASDYKFGIILDLLDGNQGVLEKWKIEGAWIKSADYGELDYCSSEAATIALTIRFDHARQELTSAGVGTALGGNL